MSADTTVPGGLLPGLLRRGVDVICGDLAGVVWSTGTGRGVEVHLDAGYVLVPTYHCRIACMVNLATPTGWDAAVACLAQRYGWDLAPHERALFWHHAGRWTLSAQPSPLGWERLAWWTHPEIPGPDDPIAALRAVLLHEAQRKERQS